MFTLLKDDFKRIFIYPNFKKNTSLDYDLYWESRRTGLSSLSEWQRERIDIISQYIKNNSSVLDIGSGDGSVLEELRNRKLIVNSAGVDCSVTSIESLKRRGFLAFNLNISDINEFSKIGHTYDYTIAFEIIEHVSNPEEVVKAMLECTKEYLFISVPNTGYYAYRLRLLLGSFPVQWVIHPSEHLRFWTLRDMKKWCSWNDFLVQNIYPYKGPFILRKIFPSLFAMGMVIVLKRK